MSLINLWSRKQDKQQLFESLLAPYIEHLYKLAYRFRGNQADAEDLVQDLLIKLYPRTQEMSGVENLKPWLDKILYHLFIDQKRKESRSPINLKSEDLDENTETNHPLTFINTQSQENDRYLEQVFQALNELNSDQHSLIILHDLEGYTLSELEQMLETPIGTLKSRLNRARGKLRELLMEPNSNSQRYKQMRG
ncbi:MAG: RNA polymerase sigma factor [Gammaproteobacteria bacterium]|nr:RNA polymerase sigma factor [Gammaproteobacteria bacterium]